MNLFRKVSPLYVPAAVANKGGLVLLRERILHSMLLIVGTLGLPSVILGSRAGIMNHEYILPVFYSLIYLTLFVMIFVRDLPYALRAHTIITLYYLMALSELFESGQIGEVRMFLIAYVAVTAVLFNYRNVIAAILLSVATISGAGILSSLPPNTLPITLPDISKGTDWITSTSVFLMIATMVSGSVAMIIGGLETNLKKQEDLTQSLEFERDTLEDRIHERTRSMARRMVQLRTAAEISRSISALSDPELLLQQVVNLIRERFDLYYVGIFLLDNTRQNATLQAGTGEAGKSMLSQGHQLTIGGSSMIGWSIANRQPRIALDVGSEAVRFNNPYLPLTRSELALPIVAHDQVLGAMTIQSEKPNAFDENDIAILESVADSLAIALENDRLFHETRLGLEEIRSLNRDYLQQAWSETIKNYGELSFDYENTSMANTGRQTNIVDVPLMLRDEVIGMISLEIDRPGLSEDENTFVENITTQTAIALENARLLHETERRAVQEQKLNELTTRFSRAMSIDEILRTAAQELGQLPAVAGVSVQMNPAGSGIRPAALSSGVMGSGNGKERTS